MSPRRLASARFATISFHPAQPEHASIVQSLESRAERFVVGTRQFGYADERGATRRSFDVCDAIQLPCAYAVLCHGFSVFEIRGNYGPVTRLPTGNDHTEASKCSPIHGETLKTTGVVPTIRRPLERSIRRSTESLREPKLPRLYQHPRAFPSVAELLTQRSGVGRISQLRWTSCPS